MAWTTTTQTSIGLTWDASSDDIGVTRLPPVPRRRGGRDDDQSLSYTVSGLACGTSYTIAVEAYDAAGNASDRAEAAGTTSTDGVRGRPRPDADADADARRRRRRRRRRTPTDADRHAAPPPRRDDGEPVGRHQRRVLHAVGSRVAYSDATACGSIDAANDKCQNGDLVLIKGGNYTGGGQNISGSGGRSAMCRIDVVTGERAMMKSLSLGGVQVADAAQHREPGDGLLKRRHLVRGQRVQVPNNKRAVYIGGGSEDIVIENVHYGGFGIFDSRRVTIRDSDFGPCDSYDGQDPGAAAGGLPQRPDPVLRAPSIRVHAATTRAT